VRVCVTAMLIVLTSASVLLWLQAMKWRLEWQWIGVIVLLLLSSYQMLEGLYSGQLGLLVAFLFAAGILALQRGRFFFSGFLMALTTIKPQVTGLAIIFLLLWSLRDWRARRGFCLGFISTFALLMAASLVILPHWIESWLRTLIAYHDYSRPPLITELLTSRLPSSLNALASIFLTVVSIGIALALAWRNRSASPDSRIFWLTLATFLGITVITILPGQALYDHGILLPGILLVARHRDELVNLSAAAQVLLRIGALILLWPGFAAVLLLALYPLLTPAQFYSPLFFSLPLRAAPPLPFATLALLGWMWWFWAGSRF
jgi:hypothetical protein